MRTHTKEEPAFHVGGHRYWMLGGEWQISRRAISGTSWSCVGIMPILGHNTKGVSARVRVVSAMVVMHSTYRDSPGDRHHVRVPLILFRCVGHSQQSLQHGHDLPYHAEDRNFATQHGALEATDLLSVRLHTCTSIDGQSYVHGASSRTPRSRCRSEQGSPPPQPRTRCLRNARIIDTLVSLVRNTNHTATNRALDVLQYSPPLLTADRRPMDCRDTSSHRISSPLLRARMSLKALHRHISTPTPT